MSSSKRPASNAFGTSSQIVKRQKSEAGLNGTQNGALIQAGTQQSALGAPLMELSGHSGEVFAARFDPTGQNVASGSMDKSILLWHAHGHCENFGKLEGHKAAILDLHWSRDSRNVFSASADTMLASWDVETGTRIHRYVGHEAIVNSLDVRARGGELIVSGSDDCSIGIWDPRQKEAFEYFETDFPVTAVQINEAASEIYSGGIDNEIKVWDMRKKAVVYTLPGHTDTVTSLEISHDNQKLLSKSMDSTVRTWDIRSFAPTNRHIQTYDGAPAGVEKNLIRASWNETDDKIATGSGDRVVVVWEAGSGKLLYRLPGHRGTVNDVRFSPGDNPLLLSASTDRTIMLGELGR